MKDTARLNPENWLERYGDMLFRFALQRVNDMAMAEDLVQESLLAAINAKDRFQGQSSERTWLFAILKHKVIDYYRTKKHGVAGVKVEAIAETSLFNENGNMENTTQALGCQSPRCLRAKGIPGRILPLSFEDAPEACRCFYLS